ncbi:hypothetical protein Q31b_42820 [Novipirellula aureliae]|uniref:Uncharacterized protein n=1 Tax=Novipirellula aureliae TaxID=2527966 RepID=A0A5C6DMW1_9BACT|nr:hypothetical protein Q31b_42820 [Novipirellula aureliae]
MEFQVHGRATIERGIVVRSAYVLISIRDPESPVVGFTRPTASRDVLSLAFHDEIIWWVLGWWGG